MTIAFNCWVLRNKNVDGIGNVVIETLRSMIRDFPETHFLLLCDKGFSEDYFEFPNVSIHRIFPPYRHPVLYIYYLEFVLPGFLKKHRPDIFVGLDGMISLRSACRQISVIHDLNFVHFPEALPLRNRLYYRYYFKRFASKASRIVAVSNYTRADIVRTYGTSPEKIDIIRLGAKKIFEPLDLSQIAATREKYTNGHPYFFFVGSMHGRKNIIRLMLAFDRFKLQSQSDYKLVLAGNILWDSEQLKTEMEKLPFKQDILFPGRISDTELKYLLGASQALVFVPLFEGFGLPIVEAFQAGVPVICSNTSSMPEVAGDAALFVDPFKVEAIAAAMQEISGQKVLREKLILKGNERKALFSWDQTAQQLHAVIVQTLNGRQ